MNVGKVLLLARLREQYKQDNERLEKRERRLRAIYYKRKHHRTLHDAILDRLAFALMDMVAWLNRRVWSKKRVAERTAWTYTHPCGWCGKGAHLWVHQIGWWVHDGWRPARYI